MAAQPKRRISTYRGGKRYAAKKIGLKTTVKCKNCNQQKRPHYLCPNCGK